MFAGEERERAVPRDSASERFPLIIICNSRSRKSIGEGLRNPQPNIFRIRTYTKRGGGGAPRLNLYFNFSRNFSRVEWLASTGFRFLGDGSRAHG
jgi:hypothetical protein